MDPQRLHRHLLDPAVWPGPPAETVAWTETHVSRLYFVGERVYKVKKPVDLGFLDFTTRERRRFFCHEEVRLNDRFAPDTYLGVADLCLEGGRVRLGGPGAVIDHAVVMRRLPAERMLDRLIAADEAGLDKEMERLAGCLARLHAESAVCRGNGADLARIRANWDENFRQAGPMLGTTLEPGALAAAQRHVGEFLERAADLLLRREAGGQVRDGHGDLHAEHVCLTDPVRIYDCIEFNRRFRVADTAADLAFLLMDLEFRERPDLARLLLDRYRAAGAPGTGDLPALLPFYKLYRAWVRGKVNSILALDPAAEAGVRREATALARRYFNLALGYLAPPALFLTCGLMGTGKSTLARRLAAATGALLLRSDVVRKELAGRRGRDSATLAFGEGIYAPAFTAATYRELLERALPRLRAGGTVIVDAAFGDRGRREDFRRAAAQAGAATTLLLVRCPQATALERLARRREAGSDPSDGRPELYHRQAAAFEAPGRGEARIEVDTTRDVDYNVHFILSRLAAGGRPETP